jgi:hypothetical protein
LASLGLGFSPLVKGFFSQLFILEARLLASAWRCHATPKLSGSACIFLSLDTFGFAFGLCFSLHVQPLRMQVCTCRVIE